MPREKPTLNINGFYNYYGNVLVPQNTESGKPELNNVGDKSQYNNALITQVGMVLKKTHKEESLIL